MDQVPGSALGEAGGSQMPASWGDSHVLLSNSRLGQCPLPGLGQPRTLASLLTAGRTRPVLHYTHTSSSS